MKTLILAFYISIATEPIVPGPDKYGAGMSMILIGASELESARSWADNYARAHFLKKRTDQKISEIKVLPVDGKLITPKGSEEIIWSRLKTDLEDQSYEDHPYDFGSSVGVEFKKVDKMDRVDAKADDPETLRKALGKEADKMNWDPNKLFYFVAYTGKRAFLVQSMNLMASTIPLHKEIEQISHEGSFLEVSTCPGFVFQYNTSEQDAVANP